MRNDQLVTVGVLVLVSVSIVYASIQSRLQQTGAPGEGTCWSCHHTYSNNNPAGSITFTASQSTYSPGDYVDFYVKVAHPGMKIWGFQATGVSSLFGNTIGTILESSTMTELFPAGNRFYVRSTASGSYSEVFDSIPGWTFRWKAPYNHFGETVTFHAAAVAGDGSGSLAWDYSHSASITLPFVSAPSCCVGTVGNVDCDPDDNVDISDLTALVNYLFIDFEQLCCYDEGFLADSPEIDIGDLTVLVDHLFMTFQPLRDCQY